MADLLPCPFCSKTMMLRSALWPSEGDADAIIHADPTDCPMLGFSDGSADGSIIEKWNCSLSNEDDFPSDGSCVRCGSVPRNANGLCNTCLDEDAERLENTRTAPAATDTGMETFSVELTPSGHPYMKSDPDGDYVTRSQAVELLAAERAEKEKLEAAWLEGEGIISNLKAELAEALRGNRYAQLERIAVQRAEKAEADLAAERARKEMLAESLHIQIKRVNELEADNAAQAARIEFLERVWKKAESRAEALEAKLAAAQEAHKSLFGDKTMEDILWPDVKPTDLITIRVQKQIYDKARAVLGGKPS